MRKNKSIPTVWIIVLLLTGCQSVELTSTSASRFALAPESRPQLAAEVKAEAIRCWNSYKKYAWGYDVLLPISRRGHNWYNETLGISPFDAYGTLKVMGLDEQAREIEAYALGVNWDKDVYVQVFEVNIRILGGLLSMYDHSGNPAILEKARDFANRILPAFATPTGIPTHSVNLRTGATSGDGGTGDGTVVNVAQAATYLFEFGILSYYTSDPKYYQAAKRATLAVFSRRSELGLVGEQINVETGEWASDWSHLQACIDSYYEYMFKSLMIFPDPEIRDAWDRSVRAIDEQLYEEYDGRAYYTIVDMNTGTVKKRSVSLYDAFYPGIQAMSGQLAAAERNQKSWHWLWKRYGLLPSRYQYDTDEPEYPNYELNPEIIESAYHLHQITGSAVYLKMLETYWADLKRHCMHDVAFHSIEDVRTMRARDYMPTYFLAETLKYFYMAFAGRDVLDYRSYVFSTEAHTFRRLQFDPMLARGRLGY